MANHSHFANALRDLKTRFGVEASDLTPDELFELVEAVKRIENPFREVNADALGFPVKVCDGLYFWKLSAGASAWLDDYAADWWGDEKNEKKYFWALCYALANSRKREAFVSLDTPRIAYKAIRKFVLGIPANQRELALAVDKVLGRVPDDDDPKNGKTKLLEHAIDWSHVAARLESESGIKQEDWLWGRSASYTIKAYNDLKAFAKRYGAAGGEGAERLADELNKALTSLAKVIVRIGNRVKAAKESRHE